MCTSVKMRPPHISATANLALCPSTERGGRIARATPESAPPRSENAMTATIALPFTWERLPRCIEDAEVNADEVPLSALREFADYKTSMTTY